MKYTLVCLNLEFQLASLRYDKSPASVAHGAQDGDKRKSARDDSHSRGKY